MQYDRPFLDYASLVSKLINEYGLIVQDENTAIDYLRKYSYYDLINGYQECFIDDVSKKYKNNTTIEYLVEFHNFDRYFQNILFMQSVLIEKIFKNSLANYISTHISEGEKDYLDPHYYSRHVGNTNINNVLYNIKKKFLPKSFQDPTAHYQKTHNHIPPWILFKNVSFIDTIDLFLLCNKKIQTDVANDLISSSLLSTTQKIDIVKNSITIIRKGRNTIAHNLKFIGFEIKSRHSLKKKDLNVLFSKTLINQKDLSNNIGIKDIYSMILSIIILLDDNVLISNFIYDIINFLNPNSVTNPDLYNIRKSMFSDYALFTKIPKDLDIRLLRYLSTII